MNDPFNTGADVNFIGDAADWRDIELEVDPDDELLEETPEDVSAILGFDPKDIENE